MEISSTNYIHGVQALQGPHRTTGTATETMEVTTAQGKSIQDDIRLSDEAKNVNAPEQNEPSSSGVRFELVNRIKAEIAAGTYETPDKMDIAFERLLAGITAR